MPFLYEDTFRKYEKPIGDLFYMITSDGTSEDGTGAILCRKHKNPKKAYIIQVPYWCVKDNEAGDAAPGLITRLHPVTQGHDIDTFSIFDYTQHIYYALKKFVDIKWYERCLGDRAMVQDVFYKNTIEKIVHQLNVAILMIDITNNHIIHFFKRVLWCFQSFHGNIYPATLDHMVECIRRGYMAKVIQRQWRRSIADPAYVICQWRLQREFADAMWEGESTLNA
jgi:hypothetical protein